MKVLWLSPNSGIYNENNGGYGTGGWIGALQRAIIEYPNDMQIALAFPCDDASTVREDGTFRYYSVHQESLSIIGKLLLYYGLKKKNQNFSEQLKKIVDEYQPDIIHIFGMENPFVDSVAVLKAPIVVHLQGLMLPIANAYFPAGFSKASRLKPISKREWLIRNGIGYSYNDLLKSAERESIRFANFHNFMGRTDFDCIISSLMSPNSHYYKVNEVMRPVFYQSKSRWAYRHGNKAIIFSTLSEATYKGVDVILKTADVLKNKLNLDFEWRIAGISVNTPFVRIFEHHYHFKSEELNIKYMGILSAEQIQSVLLEASVFVHPSYIDNSPNSVCEAQMLGVPVIACDVGGVSTILDHGESGILVPANAPYEMAYYIKEVTNNKDLAEQLSQSAFQYSHKRHSKDNVVKDLYAAYKDIISRK